MIEKVKCPVCNNRLFDKENKSRGKIPQKCPVCRNIWRIDLATLDFNKQKEK